MPSARSLRRLGLPFPLRASSVLTASVGLAALLATACVSDHRVRGPDGEIAHSISCSSPDGCYERASKVCPGGYVIRTTAGAVVGSFASASGGVHSTMNLLVTCKSNLPETAEALEPEEPEDQRACGLAFRQAADFATYYERVLPHGPRLEALPTRRDFVAVCRKLPENVQPCLHDKYREEHAKACDAVVTRLEPGDRRRLDGLFFEAQGSGEAGAR